MGYHFGPLNDTYCLKSGKCILHPVGEYATINTGDSPTAGGSHMKTAKPRKKMTQAQARKKWLASKQGQKWLAEKIRFEADLEIASELRKFC